MRYLSLELSLEMKSPLSIVSLMNSLVVVMSCALKIHRKHQVVAWKKFLLRKILHTISIWSWSGDFYSNIIKREFNKSRNYVNSSYPGVCTDCRDITSL